jgi:hypothetical protein
MRVLQVPQGPSSEHWGGHTGRVRTYAGVLTTIQVWAGDCRSAVSGITNALAVFNNLFRTFGANETGDYVDPWLTANNIMQQARHRNGKASQWHRNRNRMARHGMAWHGMAWHGMACNMRSWGAQTVHPSCGMLHAGAHVSTNVHTWIIGSYNCSATAGLARYTMQRPAWLATACNGRLGSLQHATAGLARYSMQRPAWLATPCKRRSNAETARTHVVATQPH